jgi:hypothetical protein
MVEAAMSERDGRFGWWGRCGTGVAVAVLLLGACSERADLDPTRPGGGAAASVEAVSGQGQAAVVGTELAEPVVVRVRDAQGRAVAGVPVSFVVVSGGGSVFLGQALTDAEGIARERWTLGASTAEPQRLEARALDGAGSPLVETFTAAPRPDAPARVEAASAEARAGVAGRVLGSPLEVRVTDRYGNPVAGVEVRWTVLAGAGAVEPAAVVTDAAGLARATWTLGPGAGAQAVEARAGALQPVVFTAAAAPDEAAELRREAGAPAEGRVGQPLAELLVVRVVDRHGNPVAGVEVRWTVTSGGGGLSPSVTHTDERGEARSRWTLGPAAGEQRARAETDGLAPVTFTTVARPGEAAALVVVAGSGQAARVTEALPALLVARVVDEFGNPVPGAAVGWEVLTTGGGAVAPVTALTDAEGRVSARWTLGTVSGSHGARATLAGVGEARFDATALADAPAALERTTDAPLSGPAGHVLPQRLEVRVVDRFGNPVPGVAVAWRVLTGEGRISAESGPTDAGGVAWAEWTLGTGAGPQTAEARLAGGGQPALVFHAAATAGLPADIVLVSGDGQEAPLGTVLPQPLVARAVDEFGNPVPGAQVWWLGGGIGAARFPGDPVPWGLGGVITPSPAATDEDGLARGFWRLPRIAGDWSVDAVVTIVPTGPTSGYSRRVTFRATALPVDALQVVLVQHPRVGERNVVRAYGSYADEIPNSDLVWTSSDPSVATVSGPTSHGGYAIGVSAGTATITATQKSTGHSGSVEIIVRP